MKWYHNGDCDGVVLSTRVRLARNIASYPFSPKLNDEQRAQMLKETKEVFEKYGTVRYNFIDMTAKSALERSALVEEHLISREFASGADSEKRMLVYDENGSASVMVGEEDHLRIQAVRAGFDTEGAYAAANAVDEMLSKGLEFAFDEKLGYLTCCPSNTGTGMRASCMLHLPMLTRNNYMKSLVELCTRMGLTVRGFYGEGSRADGEIYQVSNQVTLGISEEETLRRLSQTVQAIVEKENKLREKAKKAGADTEDKLWRSFGILRCARKLDSAEFLSLWSDCLLGKTLGILPELENKNLVALLIESMPAHIAVKNEKANDPVTRDVLRAERVREALS